MLPVLVIKRMGKLKNKTYWQHGKLTGKQRRGRQRELSWFPEIYFFQEFSPIGLIITSHSLFSVQDLVIQPVTKNNYIFVDPMHNILNSIIFNSIVYQWHSFLNRIVSVMIVFLIISHSFLNNIVFLMI